MTVFGSEVPMEPTEYGGRGGGLGERAAETALGRELTAADRLQMARRAPLAYADDAATTADASAMVDPATGMTAVQPNP